MESPISHRIKCFSIHFSLMVGVPMIYRVSLWFGDILALQADGLTQTTNETIEALPEHIVTRTGLQYLTEIRQQVRSIRTGEARVVSSHHNLPCRDLVLTVTPRFSDKYRTAAETALFSCYKSVLEVSVKTIKKLALLFLFQLSPSKFQLNHKPLSFPTFPIRSLTKQSIVCTFTESM